MSIRRALISIGIGLLLLPAGVFAAKCTHVLPPEVFAYFGENADEVDCDDYEYKLVDLNDDGQDEILVTNYLLSHEAAGYFNFEVFEKKDDKWKHIATVPGRYQVLESVSHGYHDLAISLLGRRCLYQWDGQTYRDSVQLETTRETTRTTPTPSPTPTPTPAPNP